jgi:hypothetical protein
MELFDIAEREYLDLLASEEPVKFPDRHFCSEGRKHQLIDIDGESTCRECGLIVGRTRYVSEYGCWDRIIMCKPATVDSKVYGFIKRKGVSGYELFGKGSSEIINKIVIVCEAEEPRGRDCLILILLVIRYVNNLVWRLTGFYLGFLRGSLPTVGVGKYLRH